MKFSFNFPEPSVEFEGLRFGFRISTYENVYGLDISQMTVVEKAGGLEVRCSQLVWAGGQEKAPGQLIAHLRKNGSFLEWDAEAEAPHPIKSIATALRGVPRGKISSAGQNFFDPKDDEVLLGYPFSAGGLFGPNAARGMETPLAVLQSGEREYFFLSSLDDRVRAKRFYFQPGEKTYRVDLIFEKEGWEKVTRVRTPVWRVGRASSLEGAVRPHYEHLERAFQLPAWETRKDVPSWLRDVALVVSLHGMSWTGYIFNDFPKMLKILEWVATQIPAQRVLVFIAAWDGRYYWDYPVYKVDDRLGGEAGFRALIENGRNMGFHFMPMFGANAANRELPVYRRFADAATSQIDGDQFDINWTDWDRDAHGEGSNSYMNLGVDSWRQWLSGRIADIIERFHVDGYFLDIAGGWVNNPKADMHEGMRRLVADLGAKYPQVFACGEMHYDALLSFIPLYHAFSQFAYPAALNKYGRAFQHLSHPAPARGSSGVHEFGFSRFDSKTFSLNNVQIPTLTVVDDTFDRYRDLMGKVIERARERARIR